MSEIILSQFAAGTIVGYIFADKPSQYIPFKGNFPILPKWRLEEYNENLDKFQTIPQCPDWMQEALVKGERVRSIDEGFQNWLRKHNKLNDFKKFNNDEKATLLVRYLDENCLDLSSLQIN